jgi:hypothetical protein
MKSAYKFNIILVLLFIVGNVLASPAKQVFTKNVKKEFSISSDAACSISNKYGLVELKTWDKNKIKVDVLISVNASTESSANKTLNSIDIEFDHSDDYLSAVTQINEKISSWGVNKNLSIDYLVYLPANLSLVLTNKYGDVKLPSYQGDVKLNLKYGDAVVKEQKGDFELELAHGNLQALAAGNLSANVSYSQVSFSSVDNVRLNSKYSGFKAIKVNSLVVKSKYDKLGIGVVDFFDCEAKYTEFRLGSCEKVLIEAEFSDVNVERLKNTARLNMRYGKTNIDAIEKGFGDIRLSGKYTNFNVNVEDGANYQIIAVGDYAGIDYPNDLRVTYEVEKSSFHELEGYVGVQGSRSKIQAVLNYGGLEINE